MLHSDWFTLIAFISANVSFSDMMQGDNGDIKEFRDHFIYQLSSDSYDLLLYYAFIVKRCYTTLSETKLVLASDIIGNLHSTNII